MSRGGCRLVEDTREAILGAVENAAKDGLPLLIAGSFYLCAEAAALFGS